MEQTQELEIIRERNPSKFKRFITVLLVTVLLLGSAVYAAGYILFNGPSPYAGYQVVKEFGEDPNVQVALRLYMTDADIQAILSEDSRVNQFSVFPKAE